MCDALILSLPKWLDDFIVYYDASGQGLDYVLIQKSEVIEYAFRQVGKREKICPTLDLE